MTPTSLLGAIWLAAPLMALGIPSLLFARGTLGADTFASAMRELSQAFVPYSGVVLAFMYRDRRRRRHASHAMRAPDGRTTPAVVAVATSFVWNLAVLMPLVRTAIGSLSFETALATAGDLSGSLAWAVAPALGYFFGGNPSRSESPT